MSDELMGQLVSQVIAQDEVMGQAMTELKRLGEGVEKIAAKYGADHPEVADALHRLLRGKS